MKAVGAFLLILSCMAVSHAWRCNAGPMLYNIAQIEAGNGQVVATTTHGYGYFLSGNSWYTLTRTRFRHISTGVSGIWATDTSNRVYKFVAGTFKVANGISMQQVDAGGNGQVVGIASNRAYCQRSGTAMVYSGSGSLSWTYLRISMKYISCGVLYGCWGVDTSDRIYFSQRVTPSTCSFSGWSQISGSAKMVEVGTDGTVFIVNRAGAVFQRVGISSRRPSGTSWRQVSMCMPIRSLSYDLRTLWVVTTSNLILKCTH